MFAPLQKLLQDFLRILGKMVIIGMNRKINQTGLNERI